MTMRLKGHIVNGRIKLRGEIMRAQKCWLPDSYLVTDENARIPMGKTIYDVSIAVHQYEYGWVCDKCGISTSAVEDCDHIIMAKEECA
jgi:hypothetical protein